MTCERVLDLAFDFLDGTLTGEARDDLARHLESCHDCRGLVASLADAPREDSALTSSILERTTGPVCAAARERLSAWDDPPVDLSAHLSGCADCTALGRVHAAMREGLPRLAAVTPDPEFVAGVLARTSLRPRPATLAERWTFAVRRLLDRPRIALEGAFVASVLVVLPVTSSMSIREASATASANLDIMTHTAWGTTKGFVAKHLGTFSPRGASGRTSGGTDAHPSAQEKNR